MSAIWNVVVVSGRKRAGGIDMREFVITVNSTVDLPKEWLEERHVPVLPLKYTIDGETYTDMSGLTAKEFFQKLREGHMSVTSQINPEEAREMLEPFVKEGKDVLHLGFSSGLSGTCNSMRIAAEELAEDYPEAKIIVIDTLCACLGEGLLLYYALKLKEEGKEVTPANEKKCREDIRAKYGMAAVAVLLEDKIKKAYEEKDTVLDGLYSWDEYVYLKDKFKDLVLVSIVCDKRCRYDRVGVREIRPFNKEEIVIRDVSEIENLAKGGPIAYADYYIFNNGTVDNYIERLEEIIREI